MTQSPTNPAAGDDRVEVTQADRDAAALAQLHRGYDPLRAFNIVRGFKDDDADVQSAVRARLAQPQSGEVGARLSHVIDRDRYVVAIGLEAIRKAIGQHQWLLEGRGPYAWDDDDYRREFGAAIANVEAALVPLAKLAMDKSDCTTDSIKLQEARDAARQFLADRPTPATDAARRAALEEAAAEAYRILCDYNRGSLADEVAARIRALAAGDAA